MISKVVKAPCLRFFPIFFLMLICPLFPLISDLSHAQQASITSDGSLGTNVSINQSKYTISEGTIWGGNQFHSFGRFNVFEGESAAFTGPNSINNIIGRVTGGSESLINGILSSEINGANLYLLNPSGVMFGPNAQLDLSGSFHVNTADYLRLGENGIFYAALSDNSVLTVDTPSAFGFLSGNPVGISIDGSWLAVPEGETLSIVGGDIKIEGGLLSGPSGQINIASVASKGEVLSGNDGLRVDSIEKFGKIRMADTTWIDANGEGGGRVCIRGGKLVIEDSTISSYIWGDVNGDGISIGVSDSVSISGGSISVGTASDGDAGRVEIASNKLTLADSYIDAGSSGAGDAGEIYLEARDINMTGSDVYADTYSIGDAGKIKIASNNLTLADSYLYTGSSGAGDAGEIYLEARDINMTGSNVYADTYSIGDAGEIKIASNKLMLTESYIDTSSFGAGDAGEISITVDVLDMTSSQFRSSGYRLDYVFPDDPLSNYTVISTGDAGHVTIQGIEGEGTSASFIALTDSDIYSTANLGTGGAIDINADTAIVTDSEIISSAVGGEKDSGNITLTASNLSLDSNLNNDGKYSLISSATLGVGNAGKVTLNVGTLKVSDGAIISSSSTAEATGSAGLVAIQGLFGNDSAARKVTIKNGILITQAYEGAGGNVEINADEIVLDDARLSSTVLSGKQDAGNIIIRSLEITASDTKIESETRGAGNAGSILLEVDNIVAERSEISSRSTDTATGNPGAVAILGKTVALNNSKLLTTIENAAGGSADQVGNIKIAAQNINLAESNISATTAGIGDAGKIKLEALELRLTKGAAISAASSAKGDAGNIEIAADNLVMQDGAEISSNTTGPGRGGNIQITAGGTFHIDNGRLTTAAERAESGDITITSQNTRLTDGALVSAQSSGEGDAGNIDITATDRFLMNDSSVSTDAGQADGGTIKIRTNEMVRLGDSQITASVGGGSATVGGNISIDPKFVILENSKIFANAFEGKGGNINIVTDVFLADSNCIIDASSDRGIDGTVDIRAAFSYLSKNPAPLSEKFRSAVELLREPCLARVQGGKYNSLVVSGREAFPVGPGGLLPSPAYAR